MNKKLTRIKPSPLAGVCSGLGKFFDIDPLVFRLLFLLGLFTPYPVIITYIICWIAIPKEKFINDIKS
jgi:phage shock protein C